MAEQEPDDKRKLEIIAGALAVGASASVTAKSLSPKLGIPIGPLMLVLLLAQSKPMDYGTASGVAIAQSARTEVLFRAAYVLAASRRVLSALKTGSTHRAAMEPEKRYFEQHLGAMRKRMDSAALADRRARLYGAKLGWHATLDSRTSPECKEAHGRNFNIGERPAIGYPGAVHPHCRCKPGRPFNTSRTVYEIKPDRKAA